MYTMQEILNGQGENHILPFLWVHGEDEATLRAEVARIQESGIGAICVEARPHKDFNGPGWFRDLGILLDECKRRGMKMWVLDDSHFPTGYADGAVKRDHPALCKQFLCCHTVDFAGPVPHSGAILKYALRTPADQIISVTLSQKTAFETIDPATTIDLTDRVEWHTDAATGTTPCDPIGNPIPGAPPQGECPIVRFDLPAGEWTLNVITASYQGGEKQTAGYLNPLDPAATQILLDTVYQPIYDHFAADFGETLQGFFSDEPRFGNLHGGEDASIGRNSAMDLPWRTGLESQLAQRLNGTALAGQSIRALLPLLFLGSNGPAAHILRYAYMDLVSRLYSDHFDGVLASWCHAHSCRHIGHTIEDNNASARLGYGAGHFYRAMAHQDMAGIDVVIHQLMPGQDSSLNRGKHRPGWDGEFFTYVLGKLGSSLAHLDPAKQNRCMVELFGAYGWAEGNRLCKWLADYMLVRGVNEFVPHAFDPAPYPDADCPPHFYAHGHNPQYPEFKLLMHYLNRMSEVLAGQHIAPVALLYHAEGEWSGDYMLTQKPAALLARAQMDYSIIPADYLPAGAARNGRLTLNDEEYKALVVPYAEALPAALLQAVQGYLQAGLPVYFVDALPTRTSEGTPLPPLPGAAVVPLAQLPARLAVDDIPELTLTDPTPALRYYHARRTDGDVYFFTNEGLQPLRTTVQGAKPGPAVVYDAFAGALVGDAEPFTLELPPYASKCVFVPDAPAALPAPAPRPRAVTQRIALEHPTVRFADAAQGSAQFGEPVQLQGFRPLDELPGKAAFAGRIRYALTVTLTPAQAARPARLVLYGVQEGAVVTVNGQPCGTRICPPYEFAVDTPLTAGENSVIIEVNTTLGRRNNDFLSQFMPMEPLGITEGVELQLF